MMTRRDRLLEAARLASTVLSDTGARERIEDTYRSRVDPVYLAEAAGVAVMAQELKQLLGAFLRETRPGILLNSERPVGMMHMTCAHELGHFYLGHLTTADEHIDYDLQSEDKEQQANEFAYALLSPRWLVARAMKTKGWGQTHVHAPDVIYQLSLRLGISYKAMVWRLARLKVLSDGTAQSIAALPPKALKEALLPAGMPAPKGDVWVIDTRDKDWLIEPRSTDKFVVRLPSHATAGYLWSSDQVASEGFTLKQVFVDASEISHSTRPPIIGGLQQDDYILQPGAQVRGETSKMAVWLSEVHPWDDGSPANDQIQFALQFEQRKKGLSDGTRRRATSE
jgi:Zn-dependent peptidase ImmA (M78 family)